MVGLCTSVDKLHHDVEESYACCLLSLVWMKNACDRAVLMSRITLWWQDSGSMPSVMKIESFIIYDAVAALQPNVVESDCCARPACLLRSAGRRGHREASPEGDDPAEQADEGAVCLVLALVLSATCKCPFIMFKSFNSCLISYLT